MSKSEPQQLLQTMELKGGHKKRVREEDAYVPKQHLAKKSTNHISWTLDLHE
jgi:hypothetical protein